MLGRKRLWLAGSAKATIRLALAIAVLLPAVRADAQTIYVPRSKGDESLDDNSGAVKGNQDFVLLTSGDRISGTVAEIGTDGTMRIINPLFEEPLQLRVEGVKCLTLARGARILDGPDSVVLVNGNRLDGTIEEITADAVIIETKSMGTVRVKRSVVGGVEFQSARSVLLDTDFSSGEADPWQVRSGTWEVLNGKYHCRSSGGWALAPVDQQGPVTFEFVVSGQAANYYTYLTLFAKDVSNYYGGDGISIRLRTNYVYVYRVTSGGTSRVFSKDLSKPFTRAVFRASYDPESGKLHMWLNDMDLGQCPVSPAIKKGKFVHLYAQYPCAFESVRIVRGTVGFGWNEKADEDTDKFILSNKDKVSGVLERLKGGVAAVKTSYGSLQLQKDRILRVIFHTSGREVPRRQKGDVNVVFHNGATLTVRMKKMGAESIEANAEFLGPRLRGDKPAPAEAGVKILRKAVRFVEFNIYGGGV